MGVALVIIHFSEIFHEMVTIQRTGGTTMTIWKPQKVFLPRSSSRFFRGFLPPIIPPVALSATNWAKVDSLRSGVAMPAEMVEHVKVYDGDCVQFIV